MFEVFHLLNRLYIVYKSERSQPTMAIENVSNDLMHI